jgi:hypothetical protein
MVRAAREHGEERDKAKQEGADLIGQLYLLKRATDGELHFALIARTYGGQILRARCGAMS